MNQKLIEIAVISISIGVLVGILIALIIKIFRRKEEVDSLIRPSNIVGLFGTVEIPFDQNSKGKIRVNLKGSIVDFVALTDRPIAFKRGDKAFIVEMKNNRIWVVSADYLNPSNDTENCD
jgi:hypothetical protein